MKDPDVWSSGLIARQQNQFQTKYENYAKNLTTTINRAIQISKSYQCFKAVIDQQKNHIFLTRAWNTCTNLRKSTLLLICYFCCPFHCQSHSFLSKEPCFFCFCRWKELFEASYWNLFSTTLWYLSCAPGRARSANSSNVSVRPTSWRLLA